MVSYREGMEVKINQRTGIGQSPGEFHIWSFRCLLPIELGHITVLELMYNKTLSIIDQENSLKPQFY